MTGDIPERETLTVEFKSDRDRLSDRDLIAAVTCLANTEGGDIYLGVEDDGTVTGLHPAHRNLMGLTALIANLTSPPLTARVEAIDVERRRIAKISLPKRRKVLERLVEAGLVEAHGIKKGRTYTLSSKVYKELGQSADYVRQVGFDPIQQEQMVLQYARNQGRITRNHAAELCRISEDQAGRLLKKPLGENKLRRTGKGRATAYEPT